MPVNASKLLLESRDTYKNHPGLEFHSCRGKAIFPLEYENVYGNMLNQFASDAVLTQNLLLEQHSDFCVFWPGAL